MIDRDEATWRDRFIQIQITRIGGTLVSLLGLIVWQTNVFTPGGSGLVGFPITIIGLVVAFLGPNFLTQRWKRQDDR